MCLPSNPLYLRKQTTDAIARMATAPINQPMTSGAARYHCSTMPTPHRSRTSFCAVPGRSSSGGLHFRIFPPHIRNSAEPAAMMAPAYPTTAPKGPYSDGDTSMSEADQNRPVGWWDAKDSVVLPRLPEHRAVGCEDIAPGEDIACHRCRWAAEVGPRDEVRR